ncbi:hypothetical protein STSP_03990 [Streptomyces jeddahensis]|uniref:Uncharacterized protein n=1 Tax=Streptomyces jeddahensis TaxID=1716141 RepID=A0A177I1E8_9ACTN|nr:hypothetical protein STSP_03990 [Streptomyces jeddahensis]
MPSSITCTAVLDVRRETAEHLAQLLRGHRERLGTRKDTRALGVFKQAVLVLRWFVDGTRMAQLARDTGISVPTGYRYLHEWESFAEFDWVEALSAQDPYLGTQGRLAAVTTISTTRPRGSRVAAKWTASAMAPMSASAS